MSLSENTMRVIVERNGPEMFDVWKRTVAAGMEHFCHVYNCQLHKVYIKYYVTTLSRGIGSRVLWEDE